MLRGETGISCHVGAEHLEVGLSCGSRVFVAIVVVAIMSAA